MHYAPANTAFLPDNGFAEAMMPFTAQPVRDAEDKFNRLRLIRSHRVGPATYRRLLAQHGSAAAALMALPDIASGAGVRGYEVCSERLVAGEIKAAQRLGARLICLGDPDYPALLAQVEDAPPVFWARGDRSLLARPLVALVGTRNASSLGGRMARKLASELGAAGQVCVSGFARGIDTAAHQGSLDTGTVAVMAGGVDVVYPPENQRLADKIAERGLIVSERPLGAQPHARDFPRRNRIISGLSQVVVVVEAAAKSGSMITARNALDQGREVLAVPGHPLDTRASGGNLLIRDGAGIVTHVDDVLEALVRRDPTPAAVVTPPTKTTNADLDLVLDKLSVSPISEEDLAQDLGISCVELTAAISCLEVAGKVERRPGGEVCRIV